MNYTKYCKWEKLREEVVFLLERGTKITKKDVISPPFKIAIITKKAVFDWNKYDNVIFVLEDADGHNYINPYGEVLLDKANEKEIKKFTEKWVANQI